MIQRTVERMYAETDENRFLEVTYANGDKEVLYFKDFNSGAMIQNIVDRAKKSAIKSRIETGVRRACGSVPPARRHRRRVRRERGPAQHHQPGRLGPDLRQEGRADRLHPHPGVRQAVRGLAGHRHGVEHRPVPVGVAHRASPRASPDQREPEPVAPAGAVGARTGGAGSSRLHQHRQRLASARGPVGGGVCGATPSTCWTPRPRPASTGSTRPAPTAGPRSSSAHGGGPRADPEPAPTVSSKWGYTLRRRLGPAGRRARGQGALAGPLPAAVGRDPALLPRLVGLYQIHSLTLDSPVFDDPAAARRAWPGCATPAWRWASRPPGRGRPRPSGGPSR